MKQVLVAVMMLGLAAAQVAANPAAAPTIEHGKLALARFEDIDAAGTLEMDHGAGTALVKKASGFWADLGLQAGDVVVAIQGEVVLSYDVWTAVHTLRSQAVIYVEVQRKGKPLLLRRVITGRPAPSPALAPALDPLVKQLGVSTWEVDVEAILADPVAHTKGARVVPSTKNGEPNGFKIYAVRPSSIYARLGLANGDTIHRIGGMELSSMDQTLEVYAKVRDLDQVRVEITRRGKPLTLTYLRMKPVAAKP